MFHTSMIVFAYILFYTFVIDAMLLRTEFSLKPQITAGAKGIFADFIFLGSVEQFLFNKISSCLCVSLSYFWRVDCYMIRTCTLQIFINC